MKCPFCGCVSSSVVRTEKLTLEVIRVRQCDSCRNYWETRESFERKVTPPQKAEERIQMNLFETSPQTPLQCGEGQNNSRIISGKTNEVRGNDDEED